MNKQMRELVKQAEAWVCETEPGSMDDTDLFHELAMAKFAELIVRECANVGLETHGNYDVHDDILKHFGVEE